MEDSRNRRKRTGRDLTKERREEVISQDLTPPSSIEITEDHADFFRKAGASEEFLTLIGIDPEGTEFEHNSVRYKAQKHIFYGDLKGSPEDLSIKLHTLFGTIWEGELYEAFRHKVDPINALLLKEVFGEDEINTDRSHPNDPKASELGMDRFFGGGHPLPPDLEEE